MDEIKNSLNTIKNRSPVNITVSHNISYTTKTGIKTREYQQIKTNINKPRVREYKQLKKSLLNMIKKMDNDEIVSFCESIMKHYETL